MKCKFCGSERFVISECEDSIKYSELELKTLTVNCKRNKTKEEKIYVLCAECGEKIDIQIDKKVTKGKDIGTSFSKLNMSKLQENKIKIISMLESNLENEIVEWKKEISKIKQLKKNEKNNYTLPLKIENKYKIPLNPDRVSYMLYRNMSDLEIENAKIVQEVYSFLYENDCDEYRLNRISGELDLPKSQISYALSKLKEQNIVKRTVFEDYEYFQIEDSDVELDKGINTKFAEDRRYIYEYMKIAKNKSISEIFEEIKQLSYLRIVQVLESLVEQYILGKKVEDEDNEVYYFILIDRNSYFNNNEKQNAKEETTEGETQKIVEYKSVSKQDKNILVGDLKIDVKEHIVTLKDEKIDLTVEQYEMLKYLASHPGVVTTREILHKEVWGKSEGELRIVDVNIRRIREKIEKDTSKPKILKNKTGVGYFVNASLVEKM